MVEYLAQALRQTSREATILALCADAGPPHLQKLTELANPGVLHLQRAGSGQSPEGRGEDGRSPENAGGILMRLHWRRQARLVETGPMASRAMDLQVAKDILDFKSPIY